LQVTAVSYLGVFLCLVAMPFASKSMTFRKLAFAIVLLFMHIAATILSYTYAQSHVSDSALYYDDFYHFNNQPWSSVGTIFVIHITQILKQYLSATYLDCFMIFQAIGFWGILILMRTFEEIHMRVGTNESMISGYLLCLPTLHYWTSYIGKDAILLFAISLCTWSALNLSKRILQFCFAVLVMTLCRAHIALIVVVSLALAAAAYRGLSLGRRLVVMMPAVGALAVLAGIVRSYLGVNIADAGSVANFLEERTAIPIAAQGSTNLNGDPFILRLISLLVRPMFFDARNLLGIVASLENCVLVFVIGYCFVHYRQLLELYRKVLFIRFALILTAVLTILLATVNYNVGLGLRQRTMIIPPLLSIFVAIRAFRMRLKSGQRPPATVGPPLHQQVGIPVTAAAGENAPNI
jgi:hypothetical protein